jgi:PD-(D/E)XK endonuclease
MERLINRRQQGDLGEASAIEWFTSNGALVWIPLGHSPDVDLMAEVEGRTLRVQVKTSICRVTTSDGQERWSVNLTTNGGNQSWTGVSKRLDPTTVDLLFAVVGDGRRWCIPVEALEAATSVTLAGHRYSEYEIETGTPIRDLVYGDRDGDSRIDGARGSSGDGEPGAAVNRMLLAEWVRIPPPPSDPDTARSRRRRFRRSERTRISVAHQITIPSTPFRDSGMKVGDRLHATADGPGRVLLERVEAPSNGLGTV